MLLFQMQFEHTTSSRVKGTPELNLRDRILKNGMVEYKIADMGQIKHCLAPKIDEESFFALDAVDSLVHCGILVMEEIPRDEPVCDLWRRHDMLSWKAASDSDHSSDSNCEEPDTQFYKSPALIYSLSLSLSPTLELTNGHKCGGRCLGPLTFHTEAVGKLVTLSQNARRASRDVSSPRDGLVFSNRPVVKREKVCLRVERCVMAWHGAIRVGFTNEPPESVKLTSLDSPELTDQPGITAVAVPAETCFPGSKMKFWIESDGLLTVRAPNGLKYTAQSVNLDLNRPVWAMIDVYGQTATVLLLGSKKKDQILGSSKSSCPVPYIPPNPTESGYVDKTNKPLECGENTSHSHLLYPENRTNTELYIEQSAVYV
ncbi:E3 ubiquitin-protein ligase NEURL3-like [Chanos chanos]|uniref:E3 ubiquitin-protein ligase NEURL3-like n=1 Tax=Chanos chanos TaxID=29144 RepID=A0A6J2UQV5_CHACN|nr:E3 ubiquitin-protein ligase NEURL3-like [Chanos chanos]